MGVSGAVVEVAVGGRLVLVGVLVGVSLGVVVLVAVPVAVGVVFGSEVAVAVGMPVSVAVGGTSVLVSVAVGVLLHMLGGEAMSRGADGLWFVKSLALLLESWQPFAVDAGYRYRREPSSEKFHVFVAVP